MNICSVKDIGGLLAYFQEYNGWHFGLENCEDIVEYMYDYSADDLGLKPEECAKIRSLKQLPPLEEGQSWGIFAVDFSTARLSVTALRKILAHLVPTRRNAADHAVWNERNLLFLCFWGEGADRTICVACFQEQERGLSQIRCTYCAPSRESPLNRAKFEHSLRQFQWSDSDHWRRAFDCYYGEVIKTSSELAQGLAEVACQIKGRIVDALAVESDKGFVHSLCEKVRRELVHTMSPDEFADMYAQTIVYGLFSARCMDDTPDDFTANEAIGLIPNTNPFLKGLMRECLQGGSREGFGFDELGVGDVIDLLFRVKNARVIASHFNRMTGGGREDPVIHFYEEFLAAYDKEQKIDRGVFYTPRPIVGFTIKGVDYLLKKVFGLADGLASDEMVTVRKAVEVFQPRKKSMKVEKSDVAVSRVQLLDPATGTGTYMMEAILLIYGSFKKKHGDLSPSDFHRAWNDYVDRHVLPRLNAFELMMAPYAVAHMKLAMVLKDTGYDFKDGKRLRIFLANTLEEPGSADKQMELFDKDPLANESINANEVKKNPCINVIVGNPPYKGISMNKNPWILNLVDEYKYADGVRISYRKNWLGDDYVKFIRYGQERIRQAGGGILAYINPHGFIDNVTFKAMRWNLLKEFDEIYILNLHGNAKKHETCPDGSKDENVFGIQQGVSINFFVKREGKNTKKSSAKVYYADLYGEKEAKFRFLETKALDGITWTEANPTEPYYIFTKKDFSEVGTYEKGFKLNELMLLNSTGVLTMGDSFAISQSRKELAERFKDFIGGADSCEQITSAYALGKNYATFIVGNRGALSYNEIKIRRYKYRPFDANWIYFDPLVIWRHRDKVTSHLGDNSLSLVVCKQLATNEWTLALTALGLVDDCYVSNRTKERGYVFPLYLYDEDVEPPTRRVNFNEAIYRKICEAAEIPFDPQELQGSPASSAFPQTPQMVFDYIYGVLHSGKFRKKYVEFLKVDFPRIPYPRGGEEFNTLADFGSRLRRIHCMEDFEEAENVDFVSDGGKTVAKPEWRDNAVFVNGESRFTNVEEDLWNFCIGGYQPLQKWLKDRKGTTLSADDISHYKRIVKAIRQTSDIMSEIDAVYEP